MNDKLYSNAAIYHETAVRTQPEVWYVRVNIRTVGQLGPYVDDDEDGLVFLSPHYLGIHLTPYFLRPFVGLFRMLYHQF